MFLRTFIRLSSPGGSEHISRSVVKVCWLEGVFFLSGAAAVVFFFPPPLLSLLLARVFLCDVVARVLTSPSGSRVATKCVCVWGPSRLASS